MAYGDDWEREFLDRMHRWSEARWRRERRECSISPDERLDEIGWDIFYCAISRGMDDDPAAGLAMDGNYRLRRLVREDMFRRHSIALQRRYIELHPGGADLGVWETHAPEQLSFWESRLTSADYVYFIQSGLDGPVKIGRSIKPKRRLPQLQTGNPDELILRHVIPGDPAVE
ncbi:MAG: hypothetical protein M3P18_08185, partial [Actinomycetota bacterium]|nr:hypothetical protein [Actinomycetota bacterium]